jgi:hypothetical protein
MNECEPARILMELPWCIDGEEQKLLSQTLDHIIVWSEQTNPEALT